MVNATGTPTEMVRRSNVRLQPNPDRVVTQLFVAGEELSSSASRVSVVIDRVIAMSNGQVDALLAEILRRFEHRHADFKEALLAHFDQISNRLDSSANLSLAQRMVVGAYATNEYSVEAAALCNPSVVPHPDQRGLRPGQLRFVISLRAVGEGHISSIEFRTGVLGPDDSCKFDNPGPLVTSGQLRPSEHSRANFLALLDRHGQPDELIHLVLDGLPSVFSGEQLEDSIAELHAQVLTRSRALASIERIRAVARSNYTVSFSDTSTIDQRVIRPRSPTERNGMEDARFVRFVDKGTVTYYATYTAFDGANVAPQLLQTDDFATFSIFQLTGSAANNKGMALFPRLVGGRFAALSRWDRERNGVAFSSDAHHWGDPVAVQAPEQPWELIQIGNCGSPIETSEGWLVLTHGVGPMRTYSLGALLLDLDDPTRVRGKLVTPLLSPNESEREGYVPNVVYSCGALLHNETIFLPYAFGDRATTVGFVSLPELLAVLCV